MALPNAKLVLERYFVISTPPGQDAVAVTAPPDRVEDAVPAMPPQEIGSAEVEGAAQQVPVCPNRCSKQEGPCRECQKKWHARTRTLENDSDNSIMILLTYLGIDLGTLLARLRDERPVLYSHVASGRFRASCDDFLDLAKIFGISLVIFLCRRSLAKPDLWSADSKELQSNVTFSFSHVSYSDVRTIFIDFIIAQYLVLKIGRAHV